MRNVLIIILSLFVCTSVWAQQAVSVPPAAYTDAQAQAANAAAISAAQAAAVAAANAAAPGLAPLQTVNNAKGNVTVPSICRQQSTALAIPTTNPAAVSWTFPNTTCSFSTPPSCWMDVSTSTSGYVFDQPLNTSRTTTAVTYSFTAHNNTLSITALGALALTVGPPANSTVTMTCTAPPA